MWSEGRMESGVREGQSVERGKNEVLSEGRMELKCGNEAEMQSIRGCWARDAR